MQHERGPRKPKPKFSPIDFAHINATMDFVDSARHLNLPQSQPPLVLPSAASNIGGFKTNIGGYSSQLPPLFPSSPSATKLNPLDLTQKSFQCTVPTSEKLSPVNSWLNNNIHSSTMANVFQSYLQATQTSGTRPNLNLPTSSAPSTSFPSLPYLYQHKMLPQLTPEFLGNPLMRSFGMRSSLFPTSDNTTMTSAGVLNGGSNGSTSGQLGGVLTLKEKVTKIVSGSMQWVRHLPAFQTLSSSDQVSTSCHIINDTLITSID